MDPAAAPARALPSAPRNAGTLSSKPSCRSNRKRRPGTSSSAAVCTLPPMILSRALLRLPKRS
eukprot:4069064-Lingulodinium_polyedra.AAC.1